MKLEKSMTLTARSITAVSVDLPMNYFDKYFKLEKQRQALWHCGVQFKCFKKLGNSMRWHWNAPLCAWPERNVFALGLLPTLWGGWTTAWATALRWTYGLHRFRLWHMWNSDGATMEITWANNINSIREWIKMNGKKGWCENAAKKLFMMFVQHLGFEPTCCKGFTLLWQDHNTNGPNPRENAATEELGESRYHWISLKFKENEFWKWLCSVVLHRSYELQ